MAVRQYIGARYVPLYVGDWDATQNYEPLTIVTDANGNSFTSLKNVPAGTPLTNRNFWIQTSSFSGAVDQLQRRMSDAENDIDNLETFKTFAEARFERDEIRLSELEDRKKKVVLIGDSYGTEGFSNWAALLKSLLLNSGVADAVYDSALGGAGFAANTRVKFADMFADIIAPLSDEEKAAITDVFVAGGYNDISMVTDRKEQIEAGISAFITAVKASCPNARIHIACIAASSLADTNDWAMSSILQYVVPAYSSCGKYGAAYVPNSEYILRNRKLLTAEGNHPNATSGSEIVKQFFSYLSGGGADVKYASICSIKNAANAEVSTVGTSYSNGVAKITRHIRSTPVWTFPGLTINTDQRGVFSVTLGKIKELSGDYSFVSENIHPAILVYSASLGAGGNYHQLCNVALTLNENGDLSFSATVASGTQVTTNAGQISFVPIYGDFNAF